MNYHGLWYFIFLKELQVNPKIAEYKATATSEKNWEPEKRSFVNVSYVKRNSKSAKLSEGERKWHVVCNERRLTSTYLFLLY